MAPRWTELALQGALVLGGSAAGSTTLITAGAVIAAPAAVVGAGLAGVGIGTYINNNTSISDTATASEAQVEKYTGGSMILGASAAAATAIGTAPYYAAIAGAGALKVAGNWLGNKAFSDFS